MCATCGCSDGATASMHNLQTGEGKPLHDDHTHDHGHPHHHDHDDGHAHAPGHTHDHHHPHDRDTPRAGAGRTTVELEARVLAKNDALAATNRAWLSGQEILALNLVSAPGSGKTTLLERTIRDLREKHTLSVIEGDQATSNDSERIRAAGAPVVQLNTGAGCHLEADMVARALEELHPSFGGLVFIENVGNLVCPALFDLGERAKVAILSITEGEDKPLKYPHMFRAAKLVLLNKVDLLPHLDVDLARARANVRAVNPGAEVVAVSAKTGEGFARWYEWLAAEHAIARRGLR